MLSQKAEFYTDFKVDAKVEKMGKTANFLHFFVEV
jgi:hypothetical protein